MHGYEPPRARFRRRVAEELRLMVERTRALGTQDCFWLLELDAPARSGSSVARARQSRRHVLSSQGDDSLGDPPRFLPLEGAPRGGPARRNRFVQCLFVGGQPFFILDLPNCTLDPAEAEVLLRERTGFACAADRPALGYSTRTCTEHDPVIRQYLVGDEEEAADDIRYVLFDLYALSVTTPLYQSAASFEGCPCWFERGVDFHTLTVPRPAGSVGCPRCREGRKTR